MTGYPVPKPPSQFSGREVTAVLGPTNTGKTFLAIERMIAHSSGVIGLPLRLLAREVYQKVVDRVGAGAVSLITGEEKIKPPNARYSVCTVEAMPRQTDAAFVAIDEVQLASDLERGHVFTDRILHTRGREETLLLGASTMRPVLERLLKGVNTVTRPRMSNLLYAGSKKITRLPRRSAIVAFSADEVYAIAELIRRQRGGAAVVLGALSPRTRNAQVELYQSGEVDFLVATDAIGMGLNLDVDHVAFAQDWKFDGFQYRQLTPAELGQIAGRAGRHVRDGTFGVTGRVDPMEPELVEALESHAFPSVRVLQWRSRDFDFTSLDALKLSLDALPAAEELARSLPSVDQKALETLSREPQIIDRATSAKRVELLWEACKLPDYRRIAPAQHAEIIATIYHDLVERGHVAEDYLAAQVRRADRTEGDIDTLSQRIAEIRTWTYISHRPGWLADPTHWQENTRAIEDRLSDALHERLTKRFVDRRTSVLMKRLRENAAMEAQIGSDGKVLVEGHHVGELHGFRFSPDTGAEGPDAKAVRTAAQKALAGEFEARAERFSNAPNGDIALASDGYLRWLGSPIATLSAGEEPLKPRIVLLADEQLTGPARDKVAARAERFVTYQVSTILKPLVDLQTAEDLQGGARGIAYRMIESFGILQRRDVAEDVRSLDQDARAALRRHGVRFGAYHIFVPALVKPAPANLLTLFWAVKNDGREKPGYGDLTHLLATGRTSVAANPAFDPVFYSLAGFRLLGRRAVRVDILERLADLIRPALSWKPGTGKRPEGAYDGARFIVTPAMMSILGATAEDMDEILKGLGYRAQPIAAPEIEATLSRYDAEAAAALAAGAAAKAAPVAEVPEGASAVGDAAPEEGEPAPDQAAAESQEPVAAEPDGAAGNEPSFPVAAEPLPGASEADAPVSPAPVEDAPSVAPEALASSGEVEPAVESTQPGGELAEDSGRASASVASEQPQPEDPPAEGLPEIPVKMVQVWRPQRFEGRGRARQGENNRQERGGERRGAAGERPERSQRAARPERAPGERVQRGAEGPKGERTQRSEKPAGAGRQERGDRGERGDNGPRFGKGGPQSRGKPEGAERKPAAEKPGSRFEKPPQKMDPDSPFAKLAALRDKLRK